MKHHQLNAILAIPLLAAAVIAQSPKAKAVVMAMSANGKLLIVAPQEKKMGPLKARKVNEIKNHPPGTNKS